MAGMTYPQVLQVAKQLTPDAQWALAEALLYHLRSNLPLQPPSLTISAWSRLLV